ncbi:pas pac sensor hybrid histidine kinase [Leptolyngbya sp. Heron Island J]|uniref:ATP-binding protein n=1 Tax=Leptolyngbya sp. Heron Island J TaxID=1385935 RepID=UPI0003B9F1BF|nr:ATP-binding protein [Leptolyngbya sp. Heron Island J]ESA38807.1 pas pac sensor hybrid histidine kinase [Leptolyngbya sp. Heron Island J]
MNRQPLSSNAFPGMLPVWLKGHLRQLKVIQKIGLGYALIVGIVVAGTGIGISLSRRYAAEAHRGNEDAVEEILSLRNLEKSLNRFIAYERQLITWLENPDQFLVNYDLYRSSGNDFQEDWSKLLRQYDDDLAAGVEETDEELEFLDNLIDSYDGVVAENIQDVEQFVDSLDLNELQDRNLLVARQEFIDLNRRSAALRLEQFAGELADLADFIEEDELREAREIIRESSRLQIQVVSISVALSLLLASLLAYLISHTISRPLRAVEETALQVTRDENFNLRAGAVNDDEIGSLAQSLNQLIEWVGSYTNALRMTQKDLENQAQELNAIIDNLGDGLLVIDSQGMITRVNPALKKMFRFHGDVLQGQPMQSLFDPSITELIIQNQQAPEINLSVEVNLLDDRVGQALVTAITPDRETTSKIEPLQANGSVVLIRDITAEKEVDQMKTDFLSTVSHELRTPLTSVLGFAKLIQKKLEDVILPAVSAETGKTRRAARQVRNNLNIIVTEGERLTSLINDVLDISKIEAGKLEWNIQAISVLEIIDQAISATSVLVQNSGLEMLCDIEPGLPGVMCDRNRLIQVLINLLANAIKFTDQGSVTCHAYQQDDEVIISIIDTGIGLSENDLDKVFEKFTQVGEVMTNKPKGTGLGLPICKQIIEHHQGRIWAESTLGEGSKFSFTLPIVDRETASITHGNLQSLVQQLKENVDRAVTPTDKSHKTILVVDDELHIRQLLRQELEAAGYRVKTAKDGVDGLNQIKADPPDLIILDVMMPTINGFDLAAVLKHNPATMGIPTIILSIIQDQERGYRLGIDRYLTKPIDTELLLYDIKTLLDQGTSNRKILVVDMDVSTTKNLTELLLSSGYTVTAATTGKEGIEKALSLQPDMIIVDSAISIDHDLVNTLRFSNGLETIFVIMIEDSNPDSIKASEQTWDEVE